ncbi:MAG: polysaccharide deacetylase family protein [Bacteroidota bacterium]|nr:polysaccharide deacetylase family protein [Bacteroidota bacterium]
MIRLPCCIEVDGDYAPKARYALAALLEPLGLGPVWVERSSLSDLSLYYGSANQGLPEGTIELALGEGVQEFFRARKAPYPSGIWWEQRKDVRYPVLFGSDDREDWVASAFYWLSGWQEYRIADRDIHGRFPHSASLQHTLHSTTLPVVEVYRQSLQDHLSQAGLRTAARQWGGESWTLCPTIDVDYVRKWRKGIFYREIVEYFLLNRLREPVRSRTARLGKGARQAAHHPDPFKSALNRMLARVSRHGSGTLFLKTAAHGPQDVYYNPRSRFLKRVAETCQQLGLQIGLHPSYHAYTHREYVQQERALLSELTGEYPGAVRQHFLRCDPPYTHRLQEACGFNIDSTLGFATQVGFRNGTCLPFRVFDVEANCAMDLWEFPLAVMDSALFNRQDLTVGEAIDETKLVLGQCARYGGAGVVLWHNVLWDEIDFPGWGHHFESVMEWAAASGAQIMSLQGALESWLGYPVGTQGAQAG